MKNKFLAALAAIALIFGAGAVTAPAANAVSSTYYNASAGIPIWTHFENGTSGYVRAGTYAPRSVKSVWVSRGDCISFNNGSTWACPANGGTYGVYGWNPTLKVKTR